MLGACVGVQPAELHGKYLIELMYTHNKTSLYTYVFLLNKKKVNKNLKLVVWRYMARAFLFKETQCISWA